MRKAVLIFTGVIFSAFVYASAGSELVGVAKETVKVATTKDSISAVSMGLTGAGGAQLMQGMTESASDKSAAREMGAYAKTFVCEISGVDGRTAFGESATIPFTPKEFLEIKSEYIALSQSLKLDKNALGLNPGIESERITKIGELYDNSNGNTAIAGVFNTAAQRVASSDTSDKIQTGAVLAGIGLAAALNNSIKSDANPDRKIIADNNRPPREVGKDDAGKFNTCPAMYCKGGSEYTDDETCEAWTLCGCSETTPKEVCDTDKGKELCEC